MSRLPKAPVQASKIPRGRASRGWGPHKVALLYPTNYVYTFTFIWSFVIMLLHPATGKPDWALGNNSTFQTTAAGWGW